MWLTLLPVSTARATEPAIVIERAPAPVEPYLDFDAGIEHVRAETTLLGGWRAEKRTGLRDRMLYAVTPRLKIGLAKMIVRVGGGVLVSLTPRLRIGMGINFAKPAGYPMAVQLVVPLQFRF